MREPVWHWVRCTHRSKWECARYSEFGFEVIGNDGYIPESVLWEVGPKIEQPKEQSDE